MSDPTFHAEPSSRPTARRRDRRHVIGAVAVVLCVATIAGLVAVKQSSRWRHTSPTETPTGAATPPPTVAFDPSPNSAYRSAWIPYWDDGTGLDSFRSHATSFGEIHPFWYEAHTDGTVATQGSSKFRDDVLRTAHSAGVDIVPTVTETIGTENLIAMMNDDAKRASHVKNVCVLATTPDVAGIDIDYETFTLKVPIERVPAARAAFTSFATDLATCLHDAGKKLQITVLPKTSNDDISPYLPSLSPGVFDYFALGRVADIIRPMAYDHATPLTAPGSTDPVEWVKQVGTYARTYVPARKVVLGIALYGYDWSNGRATSITARQALALADRYNANVQTDADTQTSTFTYSDTKGRQHTVWFDTSAQTAERRRIAEELGLAGVSYWSLGNEDRAFWQLGP